MPNPAPRQWLPPGTCIGHYRVEQVISSGGFGVVYRVSRDGRQFALKLPLSDADTTDEDRRTFEQRIIREVVSLMTLNHPNIVRVHGFDRWPEPATGALYLVMDLVEGLPLLEWRRTERPTLRELVQVFQALALALEQMHRLGVVHRDIKSGNILVAPRKNERSPAGWTPVLVDFGLARPAFTTDVTREYVLVGTEGLWAPEHAAFAEAAFTKGAQFKFTAATDLHSLGLLFYQALTGQRALHSRSNDFTAVLTEVPRPPSAVSESIPECLDAPLLRLLAKNPEERTGSGAELAEELDALLAAADERWDSALPLCPAPTPPRGAAPTSPARPGRLVPTLESASAAEVPPSPEPAFLARTADVAVGRWPSETVSLTLEPATRPLPRPGPKHRDRRTLMATIAGASALLVGCAGGLWAGGWERVRAAAELVGAQPPAATGPKVATNLPPANAPKVATAASPTTAPRVEKGASTGPVPSRAAPPHAIPVTLGTGASAPTRRTTLTGLPRGPVRSQAATLLARTPPTLVRAVVTGPVRPGAVEAVLREPLVSRGLIVLSAGTVVVGEAAQLQDGGFALRFDTAQLRTGATTAVDGTALLEARAGNRQPLRPGAVPTRYDFDVLLAVTRDGRRKAGQ